MFLPFCEYVIWFAREAAASTSPTSAAQGRGRSAVSGAAPTATKTDDRNSRRLGDDDECLALLLQATPEGVGVHSAAGWLPLHAAAASDSLTAVRALLAAGGDIDGVTSDGHTTALELACGCGHADVAALLVENGASVGASDGCPPALLCAGASGEIECIQVLAGLTSAERVDEMASIVEQLHLE